MQVQPSIPTARRVSERLLIHAQPIIKQSPQQRVKNFEEAYLGFDVMTGRVEASRCIQCPSAPCQEACPLSTDIPAALALIERGDILGAAEKIRETNSLPEICGRLCPQEALCEGACVVGFARRSTGENEPPVAIGRLEAFAADYERRTLGAHPAPKRIPELSGHRVAIVGSGPAGLTAAEYLSLSGHQCTVLEAWSEPGGALVYGIPSFKMRRVILDDYLAYLKSLGVEIRCGTRVGHSTTVDDLLASGYDAVFLATGAGVPRTLDIEGEQFSGVLPARNFILRASFPPEELPESLRQPLDKPRRVVVIGGDDTAVDCARTAVRIGAERVVCVFEGRESEMTARLEGRIAAREEGITFIDRMSPRQMLGDSSGNVVAVEFAESQIGPANMPGRAEQTWGGARLTVEADTVAVSAGYTVDRLGPEAPRGISQDAMGCISIDETGRTARKAVFAGGDNVAGVRMVVNAVSAGTRAAKAIDAYLRRPPVA